MPSLHITEFRRAPSGFEVGGTLPMAMAPSIAEQPVSIGVASEKSNAFNDQTRFVRIISDANCHVAFGVDPTATTGSMPVRANQPEYFGVTPSLKLAVIAAAG